MHSSLLWYFIIFVLCLIKSYTLQNPPFSVTSLIDNAIKQSHIAKIMKIKINILLLYVPRPMKQKLMVKAPTMTTYYFTVISLSQSK